MNKKCNTCKLILKLDRFEILPNPTKTNKIYYRNMCNKCKNYRDHHSLKGRYKKYKLDAKRRNYKFELTIEQFKILTENVFCFYCKDFYKVCGVDRVKNIKGYEVGNVVSCCSICNHMKCDYELKDFIDKCKKVAKNFQNIEWSKKL